jgi:D-aminoacyl-tRNA deacylase
MRVVIQRVLSASVEIEFVMTAAIGQGMLILLGIEHADDADDIKWLADKIAGLRIFADDAGKMNRDIRQVKGGIMIVSQFTLHASTKKGNRPSFIDAAPPSKAIPLYENFVRAVNNAAGISCVTGKFGADMKLSLVNDGPVTIIIDSKNRA